MSDFEDRMRSALLTVGFTETSVFPDLFSLQADAHVRVTAVLFGSHVDVSISDKREPDVAPRQRLIKDPNAVSKLMSFVSRSS